VLAEAVDQAMLVRLVVLHRLVQSGQPVELVVHKNTQLRLVTVGPVLAVAHRI
jgi:hypothetical protein